MEDVQCHRAPRGGPWRRKARRRGSEALEFTLVIVPLLAITTVLVDTAWAIFAESTLQRAVTRKIDVVRDAFVIVNCHDDSVLFRC